MYFDERRTHFLQRPPAAPSPRVPAGFVLQLLPSADQRPKASRSWRVCSKTSRSTRPVFSATKPSWSYFTNTFSTKCCAQAGTRGPRLAYLERWLLDRAGTLHHRHAGRRCARLSPPAQPLLGETVVAQALDSSAMERGDPGERHQLLRAARRTGRHLRRTPDGIGRLQLSSALLRQSRRALCREESVKELVHFDFHNLKTEFLPQRNDVIFCRNVMMYFDEAEQKRLVEKFYRCLNPGGYLLVGPRRKPAGTDRQVRHGLSRQRHRLQRREERSDPVPR